MATQIGPKIGIEGEKEYRNALKQIINETKNLDAAMSKTASEWTANTSQMTKNKAVAQNLVQQIALQAEKLETMNQMLEKSSEKYGENADATKAWQRAIDNATASLNEMKSELASFKGAENFSDVSTKFADMGTKIQNMGQNLSSVGQKMTMSLTLPIAAAGAASVKLASDLEESSSKVDVVFGTMSESVKQFADDALNSYGLAEGTAMQMAGTFGAMATSMGMSQKEAANMSTALTALAADMASFYNVSTEVASTALQGVFTGETEALKKFGIVMTQTNLEDFAARQGKVYSKMSEGEKVMTRYAYVMEATQDAQGDFARTSDGTANSLRVFQESIKELGASLGEQILPIITPIIQAISSLIQKFAELPEPIRKAIVVIALIAAVIGPVIMIIGSLMSAFGAIVTNAPMVAAAFAKIGTGIAAMAAAIGIAVPELLLIVGVIAAVVAAGAYLAANWDDVTASFDRMGTAISAGFSRITSGSSATVDAIKATTSGIVEAFSELPQKIVKALSKAVDDIKNVFANMIKNAKKSGADFVEGFVNGITSKVSKLINKVKEIASTIEEYLGFSCPDKGPLSDYETWMPDFMNGLAKGINQNKSIVTRAINGLAKDMTLPLDASASMNVAMAGASDGSYSGVFGGTSMNIYVDHISELNDLIRIQNQAQQRYRMGAR